MTAAALAEVMVFAEKVLLSITRGGLFPGGSHLFPRAPSVVDESWIPVEKEIHDENPLEELRGLQNIAEEPWYEKKGYRNRSCAVRLGDSKVRFCLLYTSPSPRD